MLALLAANAVSWTGNGVAWVAVPWFAYELTGSAVWTSLIGFVTFGRQLWVVALPPLWVILLTFAARLPDRAHQPDRDERPAGARPAGAARPRLQHEHRPVLGAPPLGFVAWLGGVGTLVVMASAYAVATAWLVATPGLREMDHRTP